MSKIFHSFSFLLSSQSEANRNKHRLRIFPIKFYVLTLSSPQALRRFHTPAQCCNLGSPKPKTSHFDKEINDENDNGRIHVRMHCEKKGSALQKEIIYHER